MRATLRTTGYEDAKVTEFARNVLDTFRQITDRGIVRMVREYAEPMVIPWPREPVGVLLLRVQLDGAPEQPVAADACAPFVFRANGIEVLSVAGLTVGTRYRFAFEVVG